MTRTLTRGAKNGTCNICGEDGKLTEDHTPPKGSVRITQVEMNHIVEILAAEPPGNRGRVSQNGVKYRTLCHRCNNDLLGLNYDPEFNSFVNQVATLVQSSMSLPTVINITGKPQKIAKSLIGHLMAQRVNGYKKGAHTEPLRDWFLDINAPMPEYMQIVYWAYPYKTQVLARDAVMRELTSEDTAYFWIMKFFPIAFMVLWDNPQGYNFSQRTFDRYRDIGSDEEVEIPINITNLPHERWPEAPDDNRFCAFGSGAIGVMEKKSRRKHS